MLDRDADLVAGDRRRQAPERPRLRVPADRRVDPADRDRVRLRRRRAGRRAAGLRRPDRHRPRARIDGPLHLRAHAADPGRDGRDVLHRPVPDPRHDVRGPVLEHDGRREQQHRVPDRVERRRPDQGPRTRGLPLVQPVRRPVRRDLRRVRRLRRLVQPAELPSRTARSRVGGTGSGGIFPTEPSPSPASGSAAARRRSVADRSASRSGVVGDRSGARSTVGDRRRSPRPTRSRSASGATRSGRAASRRGA